MTPSSLLPPRLLPQSATAASLLVPTAAANQPDPQRAGALHPEEAALIAQAVPRRQAAFVDGRWCAHAALAQQPQLDDAHRAIAAGPRGEPLWPAGYCGSISHSEQLRIAVVAPQTHLHGIGVDCEPQAPLPDRVLESVALPGEYAQLARLEQAGIPAADRLLFCAKEATYKLWFPLTHRWLGFEDAHIKLQENGTLHATILVPDAPVAACEGRWGIQQGHCIVVCALPAAGTMVDWSDAK